MVMMTTEEATRVAANNLAEVSELKLKAARLQVQAAKLELTPSVILQPDLEGFCNPEGDMVWLASYGQVCAMGDTPDEAFQMFDDVWVGKA
jgi:hypothetical protein